MGFKRRATGEAVAIDVASLDRAGALRVLQRVAGQELTADPVTMRALMDRANPARPASSPVVTERRFAPLADSVLDPDPGFVVPTHRDFGAIRLRQVEVQRLTGVPIDEDQAWALVLADKRGAYEQPTARKACLRRLEALNRELGKSYTEEHLDRAIRHLATGTRLATNFTFCKPPGNNTEPKPGARTLGDVLMQDALIRTVWETGASQASTNLARRGAVEEAMGYSHALRRTQGAPLHQQGVMRSGQLTAQGVFSPLGRGVMPKYAALVSRLQKFGVAPRYGPSIIYWKPAIRHRVTHTPGDSWNVDLMQGAYASFTSPRYLEIVFAYADPILVKLALAEASSDGAAVDVARRSGVPTNAYIETQIHGDLRWHDADEIVIGDVVAADGAPPEEEPDRWMLRFIEFRDRHGYDFVVRRRDPSAAAAAAREVHLWVRNRNQGRLASWISNDLALYDVSGWIDFLGAIRFEHQVEIAAYLEENCSEGLLARLRAVVPEPVLAGGRRLEPASKKPATSVAPASPTPTVVAPRPLTQMASAAREVVAAVETGDAGRLGQWIFDLNAYRPEDWREFVRSLSLPGRRAIAVYLMTRCTEDTVQRLQRVVPAPLLPGGRTLDGLEPTPSVAPPDPAPGPTTRTVAQPVATPPTAPPPTGKKATPVTATASPASSAAATSALLSPPSPPLSPPDAPPKKGASSSASSDWLSTLGNGEYLDDEVMRRYYAVLRGRYPRALFVPPAASFMMVHGNEVEAADQLAALQQGDPEVVFFPVNDNPDLLRVGGNHWTLIVHDRTRRTFEYYDSLNPPDHAPGPAAVSAHRALCALYSLPAARFPLTSRPAPQQVEAECGVMVLLLSEHLADCHAHGRAPNVLSLQGTNDPRGRIRRIVAPG